MCKLYYMIVISAAKVLQKMHMCKKSEHFFLKIIDFIY